MSDLAALLAEALGLKELPRAGWSRAGVEGAESVAAHSWGVAWLVLALCPDGVDRGRALAIAVLHDLAEVRTGDVTPHDGVAPADKAAAEAKAMRGLLGSLPHGASLEALWREYEDASTPEGRFVKACDKLDMALQAARYRETTGADTDELVVSARRALDALGQDALAALIA